MLAGVCWRASKPPLFQEYPRNLFTHATSGYRVEALETVTRLCPSELCAGQPKPFEERFQPLLFDASIAFQAAPNQRSDK